MAQFLFGLHSGVRYLVLLAGLIALAAAVMSWRRGTAGGRPDRVALGAFTGLLDAQVVIGVILLTQWPFHGMLIGHIVMMVLAAAAAHAGSIIARRGVPDRAARVRAVTVVAALVLLVGGILAIQRSII